MNKKTQIANVKNQNHNANSKSTDVKIRAYHFSLAIISLVNRLPNLRSFWSLGDQLVRSATSIGANMIEAKSSSSKREFIKFYEIALKSANETKYCICLLRDSNKDIMPRCIELLKEAEEISNMLGSSVLTLKDKKHI